MKRLRHQLKAYLMTLRMTKIDTILYVEGSDNDPIYYQEIAARYSSETGRSVQIREAIELPNAALPNEGGAGGKVSLIRAATFFEKWRTHQTINLSEDKEIAFCHH